MRTFFKHPLTRILTPLALTFVLAVATLYAQHVRVNGVSIGSSVLGGDGGLVSNTVPVIFGQTNVTYLRNGSFTGTNGISFGGSNWNMRNDIILGWDPSDPSASIDTAFARNAAGVIEINNGTAGTFRDTKYRRALLVAAAKPTVTTCGTGTVLNGSTDEAGEVTATGATACTVNFNVAYPTRPFCTVEDETTAVAQRISAIVAGSFTVTGLTSGDTFMYVCRGF